MVFCDTEGVMADDVVFVVRRGLVEDILTGRAVAGSLEVEYYIEAANEWLAAFHAHFISVRMSHNELRRVHRRGSR